MTLVAGGFSIDTRLAETLLAFTVAGGVHVAELKSFAQAPPTCVVDVAVGWGADLVGSLLIRHAQDSKDFRGDPKIEE